MVLRPEPVAAALAELRRPDSTVILLDPAGEVFRQAVAHELAGASHLVFLCPRYEGVDERIRAMVDRELSIGDYVLTGGELAALVVIDAVLRLLPGAIDEASTTEESFAAGLLEYPQYTRPRRSRARPCRRCSCPATTSRSAAGACASRSGGRSSGARTCSPNALRRAGGARHRRDPRGGSGSRGAAEGRHARCLTRPARVLSSAVGRAVAGSPPRNP